MQLIVGLGNPGGKYERTRHNVGFRVVDRLCERLGATELREKFDGRFVKAQIAGEDVVLLEPMTYMNLSGRSVQKAMRFFRIPLSDVVAVHDELDLAFGQLRLKRGGGTAGHNGLRSIVQQCGGTDFVRLRMGIGKPCSGSVEGYVLSDFSREEEAELPAWVDSAADALTCLVTEGVQTAMNRFNLRGKSAPRGGSPDQAGPATPPKAGN